MLTSENAFPRVERLVKQFKSFTTAQRRTMNEDATRLGYILPLFAALGWDTSNVNEVSPEEKVSRGFVDFAFRHSLTIEIHRLDKEIDAVVYLL